MRDPGATDQARPRVALVAGGGAVKAYAFHVGVLRGLEQDGFFFRSGLRWSPRKAPPHVREIDTYVGSSAGACAVAAIAGGNRVEDLRAGLMGTHPKVPTFGYRTLFVPVAPNPLAYVRRLARRWRMDGLRPSHLLNMGGLLTTAGVEKYFRRHVLPTNRFADLAPDLFLTATQVNNARKVVFGPVDSMAQGGGYDPSCAYYDNVLISHALAAAVAVPPVFAPYAIVSPSSGKRFHYYDGEVREPLSAHVARDAGADFVIASSIWSPYSYDDQVGSLADMGMAVIAEQAIHQAIEQKVDQDRKLGRRFDRLLELIAAHGQRHHLPDEAIGELREQVCELLGHRPLQSLYISPDRADYEVFMHSPFSFDRQTVDGCIDAGHRAYRSSVRREPGFLEQLDRAIGRQ